MLELKKESDFLTIPQLTSEKLPPAKKEDPKSSESELNATCAKLEDNGWGSKGGETPLKSSGSGMELNLL